MWSALQTPAVFTHKLKFILLSQITRSYTQYVTIHAYCLHWLMLTGVLFRVLLANHVNVFVYP